MNYSNRRKQSKELVALQKKQDEILKEARVAKQKAATHEEKLKIEAQKRTSLNKIIEDKNKAATHEEKLKIEKTSIKPLIRTTVDLKDDVDLMLAMDEILEAQA